MKLTQTLVSLALVLGTMLPMTVANAYAIEGVDYANVTEGQLETAIKGAKAVLATVASDKYGSEMAYLQNLVDQAEIIILNFDLNQDKNLGELVAALNEGAQLLTLRSNYDKMPKEVAHDTEEKLAQTLTSSQNTAAQVPVAQTSVVATVQTPVAQVPVTQEIKPEVLPEAAAGQAENAQVADTTISVTVPENTTTLDNEKLEVPRTGAEEQLPIAGVAMVVAGAVLFAGAGALMIVRKVKHV